MPITAPADRAPSGAGLALHCLIVANPAAGQAAAFPPKLVARICEQYGAARVHTATTQAPGHAVLLARAEARSAAPDSLRMIIAVGGDGTAHEAASGIADAVASGAVGADHCGLFPLPAGTGNSSFRGLWDEVPWRTALEQAVSRPEEYLHRVDLARYVEGDRVVLLGAGAGLTAQVLEGARAVPPGLVGPERLQAGLERVLAGFLPYPGRVTVDGTVVHEGPTLFANVGGGRFRAWRYEVLPTSVLDDGLLEVCVAGTGIGVPFDRFRELLRDGEHLSLPDVVCTRGRTVVIERLDGEPLCFEHDGGLIAEPGARATLRVEPAALPVYCSSEAIRGRAVPVAAAAAAVARVR